MKGKKGLLQRICAILLSVLMVFAMMPETVFATGNVSDETGYVTVQADLEETDTEEADIEENDLEENGLEENNIEESNTEESDTEEEVYLETEDREPLRNSEATEGLVYEPIDGEKYKVTGYTGSDTSVVIPSTYEGKPVTTIGDNAFKNNTSLEKVTIPKEVTQIGVEAFMDCSALREVNIPDSVTKIWHGAFDGCTSLEKIEIPNSVSFMGDSVFKDCTNLKDVTLSDNCKLIYNYTFQGCSSLTTIVIPECVTSIGSCAFSGCTGLRSITLSPNLTSIGDYVFEYVNNTAIIISRMTAPTIQSDTFKNCGPNITLSVPDGATNYDAAHYWNEDWKKPIWVTSFEGMPGGECKITKYNGYDINVTVPSEIAGKTVTAIEEVKSGGVTTGAFQNNKTIVNVTIPKSITSIGKNTFYACTSLESVTIPDSVTSIGEYTFYYCESLESVTIPDSVKSIGERTFFRCKSLESITIPDSVTSIGGYVFFECSELKNVKLSKDLTSIESSLFQGCSVLENLTLPEGITSIGNSAFTNCDKLNSLTIPNGVTDIKASAFSNCKALKTITIPSGVTSIGNRTFQGCSSLESITLPAGIKTIGDNAFWNCTSLKTITIPDSVTSIGKNAFMGCSVLSEVILPTGLTAISDSMLKGCTSLTRIMVPEGVTSIGASSFSGCGELENIWIPSTVTSIGDSAFSGIKNNARIYMDRETQPETVHEDAFKGCTHVNVYLPAGADKTAFTAVAWTKYGNVTLLFDHEHSGPKIDILSPTCTSDGSREYYACLGCGCLFEDNEYQKMITEDIATWKVIPALGHNTSEGKTEKSDSTCTESGHEEYYKCSNCGLYYEDADCTTFIGDSDNLSTWLAEGGAGYIEAKGHSWNTAYEKEDSDEEKHYHVCQREGCGVKDAGEEHTFHADSVCTVCGYEAKPVEIHTHTAVKTEGQAATCTEAGWKEYYTCSGCEKSFYDKDCSEEISAADLAAWKNEGGKGFSNKITGEIVIPDSVKTVGEFAFYECSGIEGIKWSSNLERIESYAFRGCSGAKGDINLPGTVAFIGEYAFENCENLTGELHFSENLTVIERCAFMHCKGLTGDLILPESLESLGDYAFSGCEGLNGRLKLSSGLKAVEMDTFENAGFTGDLVIPDGITRIDVRAFDSCKGFDGTLVIGSGVREIKHGAFYGTNFKEVRFGDSLESIGSGAFSFNRALTGELNFPATLKYIGLHAFEGCPNISGIRLADGLEVIADRAFAGVERAGSAVELPESVWYAGKNGAAFRDSCFTSVSYKGERESDKEYLVKYNGKMNEDVVLSGCMGMMGIGGMGPRASGMWHMSGSRRAGT